MEHGPFDLGLVESIEATDIGEPGKRTFKITAVSRRGRAVIWMEKEQLFQIGLAIKQFAAAEKANPDPAEFGAEPDEDARDAEFKASDLRLRHDTATDSFTLEAVDPESPEADQEEPPTTLQFSFRRAMGLTLAEQAIEAVGRGRPRCVLCGGPQDPEGHVCPRSNGHHKGDFELA